MTTPVLADSVLESDQVVDVEVLEGWRETDGRHIAAIRITLAEGWKTYWRAPGDGGLPTHLDWGQSENLESLEVLWPRPEVFDEGSLRSFGYKNQVTLPIELSPKGDGAIHLNARLNFGICNEVCVPTAVDLNETLTDAMQTFNSDIGTAMAASPVTSEVAQIGTARCSLVETSSGTKITVEVDAALSGSSHVMVVETPNPEIWIGSTQLEADGNVWHGTTPLYDGREIPRPISMDDVRITLLTDIEAVDIRGCEAI
ncbi:MAG: protein-disulfide reductase DsbD domain-containing protein [Litoreibacter sp.]